MIHALTIKKIVEKSISLESLGINDLAWERQDAINLIKSLFGDNIAILGGDVYRVVHGKFIPTYDSWGCEPQKDEMEKDFFKRSKVESIKYIEHYPDVYENVLFSIVFNVQIEYPGAFNTKVTDNAEKLDEKWLQCPKCNESWAAPLGKAVVICPACHASLRDPRYREST